MPDDPHPATRPLANTGPTRAARADAPFDGAKWDVLFDEEALRAEAAEPRSFAQGPAVVTDEDMTALYRRRRLLQRLEGLAEDAQLEGCESAAQVLRDAAESLRLAVLRDAWSRHDAQAARAKNGPVRHQAGGRAA